MKKKSLWGVGIVISFIVFAVCIIAVVYIAINSRVDLVADNYYEKELKYQDHIDVVRSTEALNGKVELTFARSEMSIAFPNITRPENYTGTIFFFRPSDKTRDFTEDIKIDSLHTQHVSTEKMEKGMWRVQISWNAEGKKYYSEQPVIIQ
jgi:nitrogen fixation protein FixH